MNLPAAHVERIKDLGYTDSEARFLYIVAVFSGYFTLGHFRVFTGSAYGKRPTSFAQKLIKQGHATVRDYLRRGSIFHLFSRTVYGQIEKDNLRNRKKHSFDFMRTRLVLLDFILANQELAYLETEQDKVSFFCEQLGVSKDFLPAKVYEGSSPSRPTIRYFVDKFPLFLAPPLSGALPVVTLSYVDSGFGTPSNFVSHLAAHQGLFRQLNCFRFLYIATKQTYFHRAEEHFRSLVKRPLESDVPEATPTGEPCGFTRKVPKNTARSGLTCGVAPAPQTGKGSVCEVFCPRPLKRKSGRGGNTCRSSTNPRST
jgi:hypothetical protein